MMYVLLAVNVVRTMSRVEQCYKRNRLYSVVQHVRGLQKQVKKKTTENAEVTDGY